MPGIRPAYLVYKHLMHQWSLQALQRTFSSAHFCLCQAIGSHVSYDKLEASAGQLPKAALNAHLQK